MATRLKGIKELSPGRWRVYASIRDPRSRTGRKEVKRIVEGTLADAQAAREEVVAELRETGAVALATRPTLGVYARQWIALRAPRLSEATVAKYLQALEHILNDLGDYYVDALVPSDARAFVAAQLESYAPVTVAGRLRVLRTLAADAVADGVCERDFAARVPLPTGEGYTEDEPNLLRGDELDTVLAAVPARWQALTTAIAFTGLRWSEASALRWEDVDREAGVLRVRRRNYRGRVGKTKTRSSRRSVPLHPELAAVLDEHRRQMVADQHPGLAAGWIFSTPQGELYKGWPLVRVLRRAMEAAGIKRRLTPHGLRRTWNDLVDRAASRRVTRALIGHATEAMTDHYGSVDHDEKREAAVLALRKARGE